MPKQSLQPKKQRRQNKTIFQGNYLQVIQTGKWEYAERRNATGAVVILAVTGKRKLLLTEQYREPVQARVIELPAGLTGDSRKARREGPAQAAKRELLEETGFRAGKMKYLFQGPPSAGMSSEIIRFFRASGLRKVEPGGGTGTEDIRVHKIPLGKVERWLQKKVKKGRLIDPKVYTGLYFAGNKA